MKHTLSAINKLKGLLAMSKRAVYKKEIPTRLTQGMKLLNPNSGATSLVYEYADGTKVRIFTRDEMKKEYLVQNWGIAMGDLVESISGHLHKLRDMDIYVIDMPKLEPLSPENKKLARSIVKKFNEIRQKAIKESGMKHWLINENTITLLDEETYNDNEEYDEATQILRDFFNFISNYDKNQFSFDIGLRNFMQTADGELVLLDPVASKDIIDFLWGR